MRFLDISCVRKDSMEKREQYKRLIMFLNSTVIILLQTAIFAFVWYRFYANDQEIMMKVFFRRGNYVVIGMYALMTFFFYKLYGGFRVGYLRIFDVLYSQILSVLCVNAVTYLQLCLIGRWKFMSNVGPILAMTAVDIIVMVIWVVFSRWVYVKIFPPRKLLLVTGRYSSDALIRKFAARDDKYAIEELISYQEDIELIKERILVHRCVVLADIPADIRNKLLKFCFEQNVRCYTVPKISDIMIKSADSIHLFDTSLLLFRNKGLSIEQQFLKRLFDIVVSLIGIALASPFMLVIALCIKLYDGGPVFFTQERLTKDGRIFKVIKFRSMRVEREQTEYCLTRKNDERITPVGKVIRNIHFDELPQLFNILKGDMSFVGPRPECPQLAEEYHQIIPEFNFRLKVKAGLTGYAQVYGKYNTTPYDKLKLDLTYIENYSFLMDLKLIVLTVKVLFQKENTEGIEPWQTTAATQEHPEEVSTK